MELHSLPTPLSLSFYVCIFLSLSLSLSFYSLLSCYLSLSSTHSLAISLFLPTSFSILFHQESSLSFVFPKNHSIISYSCCFPQLFISLDLVSFSSDLFLKISGFNTHGNFGTMFTILNFCHLLFASQFFCCYSYQSFGILIASPEVQFLRYGKNVWSITQVDYKVSRKMIDYHMTVFSQLCDRLKYMRSKYSHSCSLAPFKIFWFRSYDYY